MIYFSSSKLPRHATHFSVDRLQINLSVMNPERQSYAQAVKYLYKLLLNSSSSSANLILSERISAIQQLHNRPILSLQAPHLSPELK